MPLTPREGSQAAPGARPQATLPAAPSSPPRRPLGPPGHLTLLHQAEHDPGSRPGPAWSSLPLHRQLLLLGTQLATSSPERPPLTTPPEVSVTDMSSVYFLPGAPTPAAWLAQYVSTRAYFPICKGDTTATSAQRAVARDQGGGHAEQTAEHGHTGPLLTSSL